MHKISRRLQSVIEERLNSKLTYKPIGHHNLGRHFVYLLRDEEDKEYILKVYGKEDRWCKEVVSLNLINKKIPCPKVIDKGRLDNGTEWLVLNKLPGVVLESVWKDISLENKKSILEDLGELLATIHDSYRYSYYGPWKDCGPGVVNHINFLEHRKKHDKRIIKDILKQDIPNKEFLVKAYYEMVKYYEVLKSRDKTSMCHHDFSARNTLVVKKKGIWEISGIIDFEHSYPNDPDIDFTDLYQTIFIEEPKFEFYFLQGYTKIRKLSEDFHQKIRYYLFNKGLLICSWAYEKAPDYFNEGMYLLKWLMEN
ncbi:aminoglycoside phosphotransferase family protein [Sporosalibacterium faouarense]|uniref:aminoglycoside phosphotransferase family protein n=1 Tax=Sporosalibacterium faouarense TaxID=516123 RepID=UPI00141D4F51|nr:aminoglycoside phosphotransferase family protein [Sporosalibacterium faouarense]MTI49084.1 aminoglycoside phosphotransferase family protein [Bacillota bacterium]